MTTLLLVEADIIVRAPLGAYLRECGFRVLEAASSVEARSFLTNGSGTIEIVLADAQLKDESGFALAAWIRSKWPDTQVILAGSAEAATERAGKLCEEEPSVTRPYDHQLVLERIRRAAAALERNKPKV